MTVHHHVPGRFGSLRHPDAVFENERATTVIETDGIEIAVVQIASRLVRQIVAFVRAGESVAAGQRIGAIRFGSQVDLVLPAVDALDIRVEAGQRVRAGETVIAAIPSRRGAVATVASAFERAVPAGTAAPAPGGSA